MNSHKGVVDFYRGLNKEIKDITKDIERVEIVMNDYRHELIALHVNKKNHLDMLNELKIKLKRNTN